MAPARKGSVPIRKDGEAWSEAGDSDYPQATSCRNDPLYHSTMAVLALHSIRPAGLGFLLVIVLLAALAGVAYLFAREYLNIGRRGPGREQSLRDWFMVGLTILGVIVLVGRYWQ
jgi:hypothetical protein